MLRTIVLVFLGALAVGAPSADASSRSCAGADLRPGAASSAVIDSATLCLIDKVRAEHHQQPLRANPSLDSVASSQVTSMVRRNYFADVRPSGQTPFSLVVVTHYRAHSATISVGQNIAWGTGRDATPARIVAAWMASPPHRRIMLSGEYRDAGIAVTPSLPSFLDVGASGGIYAVEFGVRHF